MHPWNLRIFSITWGDNSSTQVDKRQMPSESEFIRQAPRKIEKIRTCHLQTCNLVGLR